MNPMTTIIKDYVGQKVRMLVGSEWVAGKVIRIADDGQAVRLESTWTGECAPLFVDLARVAVIQVVP